MSTGTPTASAGLVGNVQDLIGQANKISSPSTSSSTSAGGALDKNAFLKLLTTQLSNQDPMKPMDDTSFISQMAQFSSLEQMQNLNDTMSKSAQFAGLSQASGMIGKYVQLLSTGKDGAGNTTSNTITGLVTEVRQAGNATNVVVNGQAYDSTMITNVSDKPITAASQLGSADSTGTSDTTGAGATAATTGTTGTTAAATGSSAAAGVTAPTTASTATSGSSTGTSGTAASGSWLGL